MQANAGERGKEVPYLRTCTFSIGYVLSNCTLQLAKYNTQGVLFEKIIK